MPATPWEGSTPTWRELAKERRQPPSAKELARLPSRELEACLDLQRKKFQELLSHYPALQDPRVRNQIKELGPTYLETLPLGLPPVRGTVSNQLTGYAVRRLNEHEANIARYEEALRLKRALYPAGAEPAVIRDALQTPATGKSRKRGPKRDSDGTAVPVANTVARVAPDGDWSKGKKLDDVLEALDDAQIAAPNAWLRQEPPCRTWGGQIDRAKARKLIVARIKLAKEITETPG